MTFNLLKMGISKACATGLAALVAIPLAGAAVHAAQPLWSIVEHFQYADGFEFDTY